MIKTDLLKGKIAECGFSQKQLALKLEMTPNTFYRKMKSGVFDSDEILEMIELLKITNPIEIFFATDVA